MNGALREAINGFLFNRSEETRTLRLRDNYKFTLREHLMTEGEEDSNGHRWLELDPPLTIEGVTYRAICAQRRTSASLDMDAAEAKAKELGIYDKVFPVVEVRQFDEDALYACNQRGEISDEDLDSLITESVSYAIVPVKS